MLFRRVAVAPGFDCKNFMTWYQKPHEDSLPDQF